VDFADALPLRLPRWPSHRGGEEVPPALNALKRLWQRRFSVANSEKLYDGIVAQARLPIFYRNLGVPDSLEGRFAVLSLTLFAVLHRLKAEGAAGLSLAQELADRFSRDMETVLREQGMSDLRVPKSMRKLAAASRALLEEYEGAFAVGEAALVSAIARTLPQSSADLGLTSRQLASYVIGSIRQLGEQPLASLRAGTIEFPSPPI
jgi:cytochrome b pre-mRNA-processing protein 3